MSFGGKVRATEKSVRLIPPYAQKFLHISRPQNEPFPVFLHFLLPPFSEVFHHISLTKRGLSCTIAKNREGFPKKFWGGRDNEVQEEDFHQLTEILEDFRKEGTYPRTVDLSRLGIAEFLHLLPQRRGRWVLSPLLIGSVLWGLVVFWARDPKVCFCFLPVSWLKLKSFASAELIRRNIISHFETNLRLLHWLLSCASVLHERGDYEGYLLFVQAFEEANEHAKALMKLFDESPGEYLALLKGDSGKASTPHLEEALRYAEAHEDILPGLDDLKAQGKILIPRGVTPLSEVLPPEDSGGLPCIFFSSRTKPWEVACLAAIHLIRNSQYQSIAYRMLRENIEQEVRRAVKRRGLEDIVDMLVNDLASYFCQTRSAYSLTSYLRKRLKNLLPSSQGVRAFKEDSLSGSVLWTVPQAVGYLLRYFPEKSEWSLQRWLYRKLHAGEIPNRGASVALIREDGYVQRRKTYLLDREGIEKARKLLDSKEKQYKEREVQKKRKQEVRELISLYARWMKVTLKSAYRWVWRKLRQGRTTKEVREEIKNRVLRRYLIKECLKTRNITKRAAEMWLKKELERGKTLEELARSMELLNRRGDHGT